MFGTEQLRAARAASDTHEDTATAVSLPTGCTCPTWAHSGRGPSHLQLTNLLLTLRRAQCACARLAPCHRHSTPLPWPGSWAVGRQVSSRTAWLQGWGAEGVKTSPLLQSRLRQGSESHVPGQSSSARGSAWWEGSAQQVRHLQ